VTDLDTDTRVKITEQIMNVGCTLLAKGRCTVDVGTR
jgi:hypothetical protein